MICVEYNKKRMTKDEIKRALPELVMFAQSKEEKEHYEKLQSLEDLDELNNEVSLHLRKYLGQRSL